MEKEEKETNNEIVLSDDDKEDLLKEFNKRGYLLEDEVIEILDKRFSRDEIWMGEIGVEYGRRNKGERVEMDVIFRKNTKTFIVEAKRTEFDWIFSPSLHRPKNIFNLILRWDKRGYIVRSMTPDKGPIKIAHHDFAIGFDGKKLARKGKGDKLVLPDSFRPIHNHVWQVLKETKAVLLEGNKYLPHSHSMIIPLIVTNARLLYADFVRENIGKGGDLENLSSLKEVKAIGLDFHEYLGFNTEAGLSSSEQEGIVKTVFIINIKYLKEVVEYICGLNLKIYQGESYFTSSGVLSEGLD